MFFQKSKRIAGLEARVYELEELLCPCSQHDLVQIGRITHFGNDPQSITYTHIKQCRKCKKIIREFDYS